MIEPEHNAEAPQTALPDWRNTPEQCRMSGIPWGEEEVIDATLIFEGERHIDWGVPIEHGPATSPDHWLTVRLRGGLHDGQTQTLPASCGGWQCAHCQQVYR